LIPKIGYPKALNVDLTEVRHRWEGLEVEAWTHVRM